MQRSSPVIGVFANQRWQSDYMAGPGNKKPQRNLGVTLQHMSAGVGLGVCSSCTWDNHVGGLEGIRVQPRSLETESMIQQSISS